MNIIGILNRSRGLLTIKPSLEFKGSRIYSEERSRTRFDPQMMIAVSDISKEYSKDFEVVSWAYRWAITVTRTA